MPFDYEQSIWGRGEATLAWSDPASFRLRQAVRAIRSLPAGARALEIGCGAGQFVRGVKKLRPEFDCYGCDISVRAVDIAKSCGGSVAYAVSAAGRLPYADAFFDAALIFDVLEHVADVRGMIAEMRRVLKPGGIAYCFVPCEGDPLSLWRLFDKLHLKRDLTRKYAGHINYFSRRSLLALFRPHFSIAVVRYSEHLLGQVIGIAAFFLMERAAQARGLAQVNNEDYFNQQSSAPFELIKKTVNSLVYLESVLFQRLPSPNIHLVACKKL